MFRKNLFLVTTAVVAMAGWAVPVQAGFFFDIWGVSADGSMDMSGGYSNGGGGGGNGRFTKSYHFMTFMAFNGLSDGADKHPQGTPGDTGDGELLGDWLLGKKAFAATVYLRSATDQTCDPSAGDGTYLNDPVTVLGFRCANEGLFSDHETYPNGAGTYDSPRVGYGDMAPVAWRMGHPSYWPATGKTGYAQLGDIGSGGEYWKVSTLDSKRPGGEVTVGNSWFGTTGYGGYSTNAPGLSGSGRWAFDWLVEKSDAHMVNGSSISEADCTGTAGELEPRDLAGDGDVAEGWFAKHIDRCIIQTLVTQNDSTGVVECKGLVFNSVNSAVSPALNTSIFGRLQDDGIYAPYLAITATIQGDADNDGACDVVDLLYLVDAFGSTVGDVNFNPETDFNCDGYVDVIDLLMLVEKWGIHIPPCDPGPC